MLSFTDTGRVIISHGNICSIETSDSTLHKCFNRRKLGAIVCGDIVEWQLHDHESATIESIKPRKTELTRLDKNGKPKAIAANFDHLIITLSVLPAPDLYLVDSYIAFAEQFGIKCSLIINKADLIEPQNQEAINQLIQTYRKIGYQVEAISTKYKKNTQALIKILDHHTNILVGQSGVGKSSIVHFLLPDSKARVGELSSLSGLGSHTTTTTVLYHLPNGGELIDSPGVRQFIPSYLSKNAILNAFKEFNEYLGHCKFNDCIHINEPKCAVIDAVEQAKIEQSRYMSYLKMIKSLKEPYHK